MTVSWFVLPARSSRFGAWLLLTLVAVVVADVAEAARALVVYKRGSCGYSIVDARTGFAIVEWYGRNDPNEGDELAGNFQSRGLKTIRNLTADSDTVVWVEEYGLSRAIAFKRYGDSCLYQARVNDSPPTAEGLYVASSLAGRLGQRGNQDAALRQLQNEFPRHRLARHAALELAQSAYWRGKWTDAVVLALDAAQSDDVKVRVRAWLLTGEAELKLKHFTEAITWFESIGAAEGVDPLTSCRALAGLGLAHEQRRDLRPALVAYESVATNCSNRFLRDWARARSEAVKAQLAVTK